MQIMCTLDTSHRNSPLLLTKVSGACWKIHSCLLVLVVAMFSLCLCILPPGQATKVKPFPLMSLLPKHNMSQYYRYYGSLTTPPCSQAVVWTLYEVPIYISWSQVSRLGSNQVLLFFKRLTCCFKILFLGLVVSSAGSIYLADLLHRGGCRAGDPSPEQFQTHTSHLQSRCLSLHRCQTPQRSGWSNPLVCYISASASSPFTGRLLIWTLAPC